MIDLGDKSKYIINDDFVSISLKSNSLTKTKAIFTIINNSTQNYKYGNPYLIEYQKDGVWYELKSIRELYFTLPAYVIKSKE